MSLQTADYDHSHNYHLASTAMLVLLQDPVLPIGRDRSQHICNMIRVQGTAWNCINGTRLTLNASVKHVTTISEFNALARDRFYLEVHAATAFCRQHGVN